MTVEARPKADALGCGSPPSLNCCGRAHYILGTGGHAQVVAESHQSPVAAWVVAPTDTPDNETQISEDELLSLAGNACLLNGIGYLGGAANRRRMVFERFQSAGFRFRTVIHPAAIYGPTVEVGEGTQVIAGSILNTGSVVEENCIINTGPLLNTHASIGAHSHLGPRSTVCGEARIGESVFIGAGAVVIQGVVVPANSIIGAGAVVTTTPASSGTFVGVPARRISRNEAT